MAAQLGGAMANRGRKHVLVVDDNSMMLKLIKEYLHETYDVATAVSPSHTFPIFCQNY